MWVIMRKLYNCLFIAAALMAVSCTKLLNLESETSVTNNYLQTDKEGLKRAIAGLYVYERDNIVDSSNEKGIVILPQIFDFNTDIFLFNAGNWAALGRLATLTPDAGVLEDYWKFWYAIIGRANEIIASSERLGLDDPQVRTIHGEACLFRARAYFELYKRFERIYLNTEPTDVDNLDRTYSPASKEEIFKVIKDDLEIAIESLSYEIPVYNNGVMYGMFTKATAKHVRAQVAMWENDWDCAITQAEDILRDAKGICELEADPADVFASEDLRSKEVIYAYQFSKNTGGGGTLKGTTLSGHPISVYVTSRYSSVSGAVCTSDQGGFGYGRDYPNKHLLDMYGPNDRRKDCFFKSDFYYNDPSSPDFGRKIVPGTTAGTKGTSYITNIHPMSTKHADFWTNADEPERKTSFRDLVVYRLAETVLVCCEAYFHKGDNDNAVKYFNMTYRRAGNAAFTGTLTLEDILDEYARELNFEGVRWPLLKRLGLLGEYCRKWEGESRDENPYLDKDYTFARQNFVIGKHECWPIPANQILLMGGSEVYPQNEGWN